MHSEQTHCRSCESASLLPVLDLGNFPLVNALVSPQDLNKPDSKYPLRLVFCPSCSLLQVTTNIAPEELFRHYLYFSSYSDTMLAHSKELVTRVIREYSLKPYQLVVELASNDGYLLQYYRDAGIPVLGVEPAQNIAEIARSKGIPTIAEFFGTRVAETLVKEGKHANVIHANNVLAHVSDLNDFVEGIAILLHDQGVAMIEAPHAIPFIDKTAFDTIYHEHLCYFSFTALTQLFKRHQIPIFHVEELPIHGGTLRIFASKNMPCRPSVENLLAKEKAWGILDSAPYDAFSRRVHSVQSQLRQYIESTRKQGRSIAAYGASAKGCVLLNSCNILPSEIEYVVDRNEFKQGLYLPGVRIPIYAPNKFLETMPDEVLVTVWNIGDEVIQQQSEYLKRGGKLFVAIPNVRTIAGGQS